jgi:hypothetical protein
MYPVMARALLGQQDIGASRRGRHQANLVEQLILQADFSVSTRWIAAGSHHWPPPAETAGFNSSGVIAPLVDSELRLARLDLRASGHRQPTSIRAWGALNSNRAVQLRRSDPRGARSPAFHSREIRRRYCCSDEPRNLSGTLLKLY